MMLRWKMAQWFEARWWRRYLSGKPVDEYLAWKKTYWNNFLAKAKIEASPSEKILDAGCGPAGIFMVFPQNEVTAIDPLLEKYRSQIPHFQEDSFPNVEFKSQKLERFSSQFSFDKIFCLNAINHVADLDVCMQNLSVALRPGGKLYLSVDAHNFPFLQKIFQLLPGDILHPHQLVIDEYQSKAEAVGLRIERVELLKHEFIFDYFLLVATKQPVSKVV